MSGIFVSYRRVDSSADAGRLFDRLKNHFGHRHVFMDVEGGIARGEDFPRKIDAALREATALVVVIGKVWLTCKDGDGRPRLSNANDWVRIEIKTALARGILVLPVLVGGASPPQAEQLPEDIRPLARRHASDIGEGRWDYEVGKIIETLEPVQGRRSRRRAAAILATVGIVTLMAFVGYQLSRQEPVEPATQTPATEPVSTQPVPTAPAPVPSTPAPAFKTPSATPAPAPVAPPRKQGMFETHDAVGGYWHEQAYAAAIAFRPDGSVEGHYYQHPIVGSWTPRLKNTLVFTARLAEPAPHLRFQWEPGMLAIVTDDSLKLEWGLRKDRYDYLVRKATP